MDAESLLATMEKHKELLIGLWAVATIIVACGLWMFLASRQDARRLAALKGLMVQQSRDEANRHRQWVAREAKEDARRLKHDGHHRQEKIY